MTQKSLITQLPSSTRLFLVYVGQGSPPPPWAYNRRALTFCNRLSAGLFVSILLLNCPIPSPRSTLPPLQKLGEVTRHPCPYSVRCSLGRTLVGQCYFSWWHFHLSISRTTTPHVAKFTLSRILPHWNPIAGEVTHVSRRACETILFSSTQPAENGKQRSPSRIPRPNCR